MRYTLYIFWAGQPILWLILMLAGWTFSKTAWLSVLAYSASWAIAAALAAIAWKRESKVWDAAPMEPGALNKLFRYAGPRAPAALFSQLLFWTDLFVLTNYASGTEVGLYSAALRAGQIIVLFLTSVSLMFSPFVADLHNRGETARLDGLFKNLTRWTIAATMPVFLLLLVAPAASLRIFGSEFSGGETALLILIAGQFVNIATGSVGFVLIMVGRTGWDLLVYGLSLALNLGLAFWLCPRYGMEGAAIANSVTFALSKWARLALVKRFVGIQPYDRVYGRLILPSLGGLAVMWVVHNAGPGGSLVNLLLTAGLGTLAYVGVYWIAGLTPKERTGAVGLIQKLKTRTS
jgi:O-antigen/teichoic acid export membrane protein